MQNLCTAWFSNIGDGLNWFMLSSDKIIFNWSKPAVLNDVGQRFPTFYTGEPAVFYKKIHGPVRKIYHNKATIDIYLELPTH